MHIITPEDIRPFVSDIPGDRLEAMINDAEALAVLAAPCLATATDPAILSAARAILRSAILRWNTAGSGAVKQQSAGPFAMQVDTTTERRGMFWPAEITALQQLCKSCDSGEGSRFGSFIPGGHHGHRHGDICGLHWGSCHCDCGANINEFRGPLWDQGGDCE